MEWQQWELEIRNAYSGIRIRKVLNRCNRHLELRYKSAGDVKKLLNEDASTTLGYTDYVSRRLERGGVRLFWFAYRKSTSLIIPLSK